MCRLFGFRSNDASEVHRSLVLEKNSLRAQSVEHKDGWGIAYYNRRPDPEVAFGLGPAYQDPDFERVSSLVTSNAVIGHIRLASVGTVTLRNAHPFIYRQWTFAHNGTVCDWAIHAREIETLIDPDFRALIKGETDSERCFYLFLTHLRSMNALEQATLPQLAHAVALTAEQVTERTISSDPEKPPTATNFLVSDGQSMVCTRRHRSLFYSETPKAAELPVGHSDPANGTALSQLVIASEELSQEAHWHEIPENWMIGVDAELKLYRWTMKEMAAQRPAAARPQASSSDLKRAPVPVA